MLQRPLPKALSILALAAALTPFGARAQERDIVSKQVSVGRSEAALDLEFSDRGDLTVALRDGVVLVDDEQVGSYEPGGALDAAWRELLGRAISLEDGALADALVDWTAPADLEGARADAARAVDLALEESLRDREVQVDAADAARPTSPGDGGSVAGALLGSLQRIGLLPDALSNLGSDIRLHLSEDVEIDEDEVVEGSLVVIDGDLLIEGEVEGEVVVIGGSLDMPEGSLVNGSVQLVDASFLRNEGEVRGEVASVPGDEPASARELRDQIRESVRLEARAIARDRDSRGSALTAPFRAVARAAGGLVENAVTILIFGLFGALAVFFAGEKVDVIADAARRAPGRAAAVGVAGTFLLLPAWILGFVVLLVSIIGIPFALAWLPLFPLAAVLAGVLGYVAVARNTGEWLADSDYPWTHWIRRSNPLLTMVGGLVGLMALFVVANLLTVVPFMGFVKGLVVLAASVVTFAAIQIGFGAVLLTRGGTRRERGSYWEDDAAWAEAVKAEAEKPEAGGEVEHDA